MKKLGVFFRIALQYLWRYRRRYLFLFLALGFGFGVVTVVSSLKDGMKENLYLSAQSHYAGDIIAMGYERSGKINHHLTPAEIKAILDAAETAGLDVSSAVLRTTVIGRNEGSVYFNGASAILKYIVGADWEQERGFFKKLAYTGEPGLLGEDSILISAPAARELGARQGDSITLETATVLGQKNTGTFVIGGIVEDASFFSYYKAYISRTALNDLVGFPAEDCSIIGFFLPDRTKIETRREAFQRELSFRIPTHPLVYDREAFDNEIDNLGEGIHTLLITLQVYLSEVAQLMNAIDLASYVLQGMMMVIILVSAAVTCRLILHERIRETGTMRAIGFYESDIRLIFKIEIFGAAILSLAAGFIIALAVNWFLSFTSFRWFPGFEVFMQDGRLSALYLPKTLGLNIIAVFGILALAIWVPVFRNSRSPLPQMLSGGAP
ncbi:MAG: ABC transporter permease [Treponema sp.]|jgi:ABC-type lipoprotein release transport system permease subunit|nr:ABC transporter permease [Treponema sp.]